MKCTYFWSHHINQATDETAIKLPSLTESGHYAAVIWGNQWISARSLHHVWLSITHETVLENDFTPDEILATKGPKNE